MTTLAPFFVLYCVFAGDGHHNTHAYGTFETRAACQAQARSLARNSDAIRYCCE